MYISVRVVHVCGVCVWVCIRICLAPFRQPQSAQTDIIFTLPNVLHFFSFWHIFTGRKPGLSQLYVLFPSVYPYRWEERRKRSQNKNAHRLVQRFTGWVAPVFKLCFLHWQQKRRFNYFGIDALVTKYRHYYSFVCFHFCFICSFALEISPISLFTPWPCVCVPVQKKVGLL